MRFTEEQLKKMNAAKSAEELIALAKAEGIEASEEEIKAKFAKIHNEGEIADDELNNVAGGCGGGNKYDPHQDVNYQTKMVCSCGYSNAWVGKYDDGVAYECPACHKKSLKGVTVSDLDW